MWACKGHGKAQLNAFFDLLTDEQRGAIEVVTADGATWIADVVEARCPNAERVMDPFHVVSWATSALDELRKQAWRDARKDKTPEGKAAAKDVKGSGPGVSVEVDGTMLHESFSGNATRGAFAMPRRARRTYRDLHVRGVSGQLACVVCGANDRGDAFCEVVGRAHGTSGDKVNIKSADSTNVSTPVAPMRMCHRYQRKLAVFGYPSFPHNVNAA